MPKITLNGEKLNVKGGQTILSIAREQGIEIPTLCFLKEINEIGFCRMCVVEVEGEKDLVSACNTPIKKGMVIETDSQRVIESRQSTLALLANKHKFNCWVCPRGDGSCDFYNQLKDYKVDTFQFGPSEGRHDLLIPGEGIIQDQTKCILCKRCVAVCNNVVTTKVLKFRDEDANNPIVSPTPGLSFEDSGCIFCGQCTIACPTGALVETDHIKRVERAIRDTKKHVIVQVDEAVTATIGESFAYPIGTSVREVEGKMYRALKTLGFDEITNTNYAVNLTAMEEGIEFKERLTNYLNEEEVVLPQFTSCSAGAVRYIEQYRPEYLPNLSTAKSPHMMQGTILKNFYAVNELKLDPKDVYVVSIMPSTSMKYEVGRPEMEVNGVRDVDAVLSTRELARMIKKNNIDFVNLEDYTPENKFFESNVTKGGVMESALRTVYDTLEDRPLDSIDFNPIKGLDLDIKEATIRIADKDINIAIVQGGKGIKKMFEILDEGKKQYHFIEFMDSPGGSLNGGGQPIVVENYRDQLDVVALRVKALLESDSEVEIRKPHLDDAVKWTYENWLEKPGSHIAHKYLHTYYSQKNYRKE